MKKLLMVSLLIGSVLFFGVATQAYALVTADLVALYGVVQPLPIVPPVAIDVIDASNVLETQGQVDFAVLLSGGVYSYFYQVTNLGGGLGGPLSRFSIADPFNYPLLGSGVIAEAGDPIALTTAPLSNIGALLDSSIFGGDLLTVGQTTKRFFFQFSGIPGLVSGSLQDGGAVGSKLVVGPVPEPSSLLLLGSGLLGFTLFGRAKRKKISA